MEESVEWVTLYRAVSRTELEDLESTAVFRAIPSSLPVKWFAFEEAHARQWGQWLSTPVRGATTSTEPTEYFVISIRVSNALMATTFRPPGQLDEIGPAVYFDDLERLSRQIQNFIVIGSV